MTTNFNEGTGHPVRGQLTNLFVHNHFLISFDQEVTYLLFQLASSYSASGCISHKNNWRFHWGYPLQPSIVGFQPLFLPNSLRLLIQVFLISFPFSVIFLQFSIFWKSLNTIQILQTTDLELFHNILDHTLFLTSISIQTKINLALNAGCTLELYVANVGFPLELNVEHYLHIASKR